jgi:hypothetical protein
VAPRQTDKLNPGRGYPFFKTYFCFQNAPHGLLEALYLTIVGLAPGFHCHSKSERVSDSENFDILKFNRCCCEGHSTTKAFEQIDVIVEV